MRYAVRSLSEQHNTQSMYCRGAGSSTSLSPRSYTCSKFGTFWIVNHHGSEHILALDFGRFEYIKSSLDSFAAPVSRCNIFKACNLLLPVSNRYNASLDTLIIPQKIEVTSSAIVDL